VRDLGLLPCKRKALVGEATFKDAEWQSFRGRSLTLPRG
jgi:hypothetical protein